MSDHKKKGDFHKTDSHSERVGGNKKADNSNTDLHNGKPGENQGHGGHK